MAEIIVSEEDKAAIIQRATERRLTMSGHIRDILFKEIEQQHAEKAKTQLYQTASRVS